MTYTLLDGAGAASLPPAVEYATALPVGGVWRTGVVQEASPGRVEFRLGGPDPAAPAAVIRLRLSPAAP